MKKLRIRFIIAAMASLFLVLGAIVTGLNLINYKSIISTSDQAISKIIEGGGVFLNVRGNDSLSSPPPIPKNAAGREKDMGFDGMEKERGLFKNVFRTNILSDEAPYETRYFTVYVGEDNNILDFYMSNIASVTETQAAAYVKRILSSNKKTGFIDDIYRYKIADFDYERYESQAVSGQAASLPAKDYISGAKSLIVVVDCRNKMIMFYSTLVVSVLVSLVGWLIVLLLVIGTSKLIFRPVEISETRQKQFLTDASHELKTPLAIIEANTEVMELENGQTQWTKSTKNQVKRLTGLVSQMVALTRLDESDIEGGSKEFNYSEVLKEAIEPYIAPAKLKNKAIITDIEEKITLKTNEKNIHELLGLLLDNAVKYSEDGTDISVGLHKKGRKSVLTVYNKTDELPVGDNDILFERFYRADASRNSQTGGSGIGLSVARSITERAKGKISAYSEDGHSLLITVII